MKYAIAIILGLVVAFVASNPTNEMVEKDRKIVSFVTDFYNQLIAEPINTLSSALASMLVQLTAGIAQNGIGKRGITETAQQLGQTIVDQLYGHANSLVQQLALQLTQILAQFGQGKRDLSSIAKEIGKDATEATLKAFGKVIDTLFPDFMKGIPTISKRGLSDLGDKIYAAYVAAIELVIDGMIAVFDGKRGISETAQQLGQTIVDQLYGHANSLVQQLALQLTQILAQFGQGKRDLSNIGKEIGKEATEGAIKVAGAIIDVLFPDFMKGIPTIGKRGLSDLGDKIYAAYVAAIELVIDGMIAVSKGKRGITETAQNIADKIQVQLNQIVQNVALSLTQILANIQINGILPVIG